MTAPDDPSATLAAIREDVEVTADVYNLDGTGKNSYPVSAAMVRHARVAVAALEAALALADDWEQRAANHERQAKALRDNGGMLVPAAQEARAQTYRANATALREAITTALTGEEGP
jgi:hypothetical protein